MPWMFLIFSPALTLLAFSSIFGTFVLPRSMTIAPLTRGVVLGLVVRIAMSFIAPLLELRYVPASRIYIHVLVIDIVIPVVTLFLLGVLFGKGWWKNTDRETLSETCSFLVGGFTVFAIADVVTLGTLPTAYPVFMVPLARLALILWLPLCFQLIRSTHGWLRLIAVVGWLGIFPLIAFPPLLYFLRHNGWAFLLAAVFVALGVGAYFLSNRFVFRLRTY